MKNQPDGFIYSASEVSKTLQEVILMMKENVRQAPDDAEDALETMDIEAVQDAHDALHDAAQRLGSAVYQQSSNFDDNDDLDEEEDDLLGDDLEI